MATLPTGYVVSCRGTGVAPLERISGVAMGVTDGTTTTTGSALSRAFPPMSGITSGLMSARRSKAVAISGAAHTYSAQKALSAGTFNYESTGYLIRGFSTSINGIANNSLLLMGNEAFRLRRDRIQKSWGYKFGTAIRAGYFSFSRVAGKRTPWTTDPSSLNDTFRSTTNNAVVADDQAMFVTYRSIPGEYVFMAGPLAPATGDYSAISG